MIQIHVHNHAAHIQNARFPGNTLDLSDVHIRGLVPCGNLQPLIYELVCLVITFELMTLQKNK